MALRKGDTYLLEIKIFLENGNVIGDNGISIIEFTFGDLVKIYNKDLPASEVPFDTDHFVVPFTQQETFGLKGKTIPYQARVKFASGEVKGTCIKSCNVYDSLSQEVL